MSEILSYSIYNKERLAVRGNRERYQDILKIWSTLESTHAWW